MPVGRYTCGVQCHIFYTGLSDPRGKERFGGRDLDGLATAIPPFAQLLLSLLSSAQIKTVMDDAISKDHKSRPRAWMEFLGIESTLIT